MDFEKFEKTDLKNDNSFLKLLPKIIQIRHFSPKYCTNICILKISRVLISNLTISLLVRLHEAMQKKLKTASYSEPIQILTLVPNKWFRMYCSEYFKIFEYLVWTSHEIKKVGEILSRHAPEKRKSYHHWNTSSSNKRFWRWQFQQVDSWKERLC